MPNLIGLPGSLLDAFEEYGASRNDIDALILFGSVARGEASDRSDIDVGVLLTPEAAKEGISYLQLRYEIINLLDREDVDVVFLNHAPPLLLYRVATEGHLLYATSNRVAAEFHLYALRLYEDTKPLRRLRDEKLWADVTRRLAEREASK